MRNLTAIIEKYLSKPTQYSVQIIGEWGIGKTHYYKNTLQTIISNTPVVEDNTIKYHPIYISLFGIKTSEEIQINILHEILSQYLSKKGLFGRRQHKIAGSLLRLFLKGYLALNGVKNFSDFKSDLNKISSSAIDVNTIVLVFDDLERKHQDFSIEEFTGYINTLVENHVKTIIICNEDKIDEKAYKLYKEKIIGSVIEYTPATTEIIDNIITTKYLPPFKNFLIDNKHLLCLLSEINKNNYRHLIYSLDSFHEIYSQIIVNIISNNSDIAKICEQELPNIAKYTLSIAIEFKASNLPNKSEISNNNYMVWHVRKREQPEITNIFFDKYLKTNENYYHYDSIFDFITGKNEFNISSFISEFKKNYRIANGEISRQYAILNEISYWHYTNLSDEEYKSKSYEVIEYAKNGQYQLAEYLTVWSYVTRFDNFLELNLEQLIQDLLMGMSKAEETGLTESDIFISRKSFEHTAVVDKYLNQIKDYGTSLLHKSQDKLYQKERDETNKFFLERINELPDKFKDDKFKDYVKYKPVFQTINPQKFADAIYRANLLPLEILVEIFSDRYKYIRYTDEKKQIIRIIAEIDRLQSKEKSKTLKNWHIDDFNKLLKKIASSFSG